MISKKNFMISSQIWGVILRQKTNGAIPYWNTATIVWLIMFSRIRLRKAKYTVSVRSGVFRHNQDSVGTRWLYRHNKTSLLVQTVKMTSTENVPGIK